MGTNLRIAFSLKKGYLLQQHHSRHDWAAQTMTGAEIQKMQQYEPFQIPLTQNQAGEGTKPHPLTFTSSFTQGFDPVIKIQNQADLETTQMGMYHVWHLLQPFWKQGGWSRKHYSPLPQTQFLHLASRLQWSSFSLNPSVSTSVNVFKISGAKQRSSLKKQKRSKFWLQESTFRRCNQSLGGHEALRQTVALKSQVEVQIHLWNRSVEGGLQDLPTYLIHQQDCFWVLMMDISDSLKNRAKNPSVQLTLSTSYNPQFPPQECS